MNNHRVRNKLLLLVGISVAAFCVMGLFGIYNSKKIYGSVNRVQGTAAEFQRFSLEITGPLNELRQLSLTMVMAPNRELQQQIDRRQRDLTDQLDTTFARWVSIAEGNNDDAFIDLRDSWDHYKSIKDVTVAKALDGYREEAFINAIQAEDEQFNLVNQQVQSWQRAIKQQADRVNSDAREVYEHAFWISTLVIVVLTLFVAGIGVVTTRRIIGPIESLKSAAAKVSSQVSTESLSEALDETNNIRSQDELGALAGAFRKMVESLRAALQR